MGLLGPKEGLPTRQKYFSNFFSCLFEQNRLALSLMTFIYHSINV